MTSKIPEIIMANRPNLSQSSLRTYMSNINKTSKDINKPLETIDDIIANCSTIMEVLMGYKPNIRKTKLSAFIVILDEKEKTPEERKKIIEDFRKQMYADADEVDKDEDKQRLTEKQEKNFITWDSVLKIYNELKIEAEPLFKLQTLTTKQLSKLQDFVLLSMYVLIPPRRSLDYARFKIRNCNPEVDNCMVTKSKKKPSVFVFNTYKNSGRLGKQEVSVPNTLRNIIQKWSLKNPSDFLLVNNKGNPIEQPKMNSILNNIFGKQIGSSMLRHIYLTNKYSDVDLQEMKDTTEAMGNNQIERTLKYVRKNVADGGDEIPDD